MSGKCPSAETTDLNIMYAEINCLNPVEISSHKIWDATKALIQRKAQHLRRVHPDLDMSEIHLKANGKRSYARLILHDGKHRRMEAHVEDRDLNRAVSSCFAKAERLLSKPKHLQH